jgi:hypothetical protein
VRVPLEKSDVGLPRSAVVERLRAAVEPFGFRYDAKRQVFVRSSGDAVHFFQIRFIPRGGLTFVEPSVGIRLGVIEDTFHKTSGFEQEFQAGTSTIGGEVWRIMGVSAKEHQYQLRSSSDVRDVVAAVKRDFEGTALPYFDSYSSTEAVDKLLNDDPEEKSPHRMMEWLRASTGLIAARLTGRANYDSLVQIYREKVQRLDRGFYLPQFESLVRSLE